ncbi:MAG: methyltransferase domain-containing protein [cyanobacterium endosymbiont of Rhopalodia gibba]
MKNKYSTSAFLQLQNSKLYAIFAWSKKEPEIIPAQSWLAILEIFIQQISIKDAYKVFKTIRESHLNQETTSELTPYQDLIQNFPQALIFLSNKSLKILPQGFRSFIEKSRKIELYKLSLKKKKILLQLFQAHKLQKDLQLVDSKEKFIQIVNQLEALGLLSPEINSLDWGIFKKLVPICHLFGLTRGTPIDHYYLNQFVEEIRGEIKGKILEIGGTPKDRDFYEVNAHDSYQVLNLEPGLGIDIVGDIHDPSVIETESVDSVIIFNVLEHCYAPWIAVQNIYRWLKIGGKYFAMVLNAVRIHGTPIDYWRPLPDGMKYLFKDFSKQKLYIYGNLITLIASYHGIATEELSSEEINNFNLDYPVTTCIVAEK